MTMTNAMENNVIGVGGGSLLDLDHGKNHGETSLGLDGVAMVFNFSQLLV